VEAAEQECEAYRLEDADIALVAYGIVSRIALGAVDVARKEGLKVGLLRPKTLYPFPKDALLAFASRPGRQIVSVELSNGQMRDDILLTVGSRCPVHLLNRMGGHVVEQDQVLAKIRELARG
jgi:2-oxoisovalerate ferredoxin oxidoreductase alpha subunit